MPNGYRLLLAVRENNPKGQFAVESYISTLKAEAKRKEIDMVKPAILVWIIPALSVLFLGHAIAWVRRGFMPAPVDQSAENVKHAMTSLKVKTLNLCSPSTKGEDMVGGKSVPAWYFGSTKINNNFALVDEVKNETGAAATLFIKIGEDFVRVTTNVQGDDGSRAIGTVLDPKGKAFAAIRSGLPYFGEADILGKPYVAGYEPIWDFDRDVVGIYFVGYPRAQ
jgi:hypothetical protein